MPIVSAIFATTMLICAFEFLGKAFFNFGSMELKAQIYVIFALAYLLMLAASGWLYVARKKPVFGIIHIVLMLGIAGLGIGSGILAYCDHRQMPFVPPECSGSCPYGESSHSKKRIISKRTTTWNSALVTNELCAGIDLGFA